MDDASRAGFPLVAQLLSRVNQYCVMFASLAMGAALLLWSMPMLARRGGTRALGMVGTLVGIAALTAIWDEAGAGLLAMTLLVAGLGLWLASLSVWLWRQPDRSSAD